MPPVSSGTTNLNNYVNLYPGDAPARRLSGITLRPIGGNSGFLGLPGDATPPSRFVRAAFYRATAPQRATGFETVQQCFHLLNNFDVPIGIEHPEGEVRHPERYAVDFGHRSDQSPGLLQNGL